MARRRVRKLYILDTNVFLHDPQCLFRFEEHDIYIPFVTLEELDAKKAGTQDVNRNARQATRLINDVASQSDALLAKGFPLKEFNGKHATGRMFLQDSLLPFLENEHLRKNDNQYLAVVSHLKKKKRAYAEVVLVSKDINLRIKARGMGFVAEDYKNDQVIEDADLLYRGWREVEASFLSEAGPALESWVDGGRNWYRLPQKKTPCQPNELIVLDGLPFLVARSNKQSIELCQAVDYSKSEVFGIHARNAEQNLALNLLLNPEVDFVTLLGPAGTGKTLLTLAAALEQVMEKKKYAEIIFTRATVPMGDDIGFLPGTEEEKMLPWMGALHDNLEVLLGDRMSGKEGKAKDWEVAATSDLVGRFVKVKAMTFMRGRTFNDKFLIIDEAQNLTSKQMKSLITRAGPGTKVICMGNLAQIDTPYLSEANSGLAYAAECFKGWDHYGQVILSQGERSRLSSYANDHM